MMAATYLSCADTVRSLLDHGRLDARWDEPSRLERMTIGELCGHLSRSVTRLPSYLTTPADGPLVDPPGYYLSFGDPVAPDLDGPLATGIRARGASAAEAGPDGVRKDWDRARHQLEHRLAQEQENAIGVMGMAMRVDDYLVTRMVELVVHADDLAASLSTDPPRFEDAVTAAVTRCLVEIARRRTSPLDVIRAMTRVERARPDALRVF